MFRSALPLLACVWAFGSTALAQSVVRGTVREMATSRPLAGVEISVDNRSVRPVRSNQTGGFALTGLPPGPVALRFRAAGFRPITAGAELSGSDTLALEVELEPVVLSIDSLVAVSNRGKRAKRAVISSDEVELVLGVASDAYEIVKRLRPEYLRGRGAMSLGDPNRAAPEGASGGGVAGQIAQAERTAAARQGKPSLPKVSVDDGPLGDLELLRQVASNTVREIRFMSAIEASTRYGTGVDGGVILVFIKSP